jgi:hypothetical protein
MKDRIVILKTFLGTTKPKKNTAAREDYWNLIGQKGKVIDDPLANDRVLVLFESDLDNYQVENHNPIKNSLWIRITDLELKNE